MKKIESFLVDHRTLMPGVYIARIDGDVITYDLRMCKPNTGILLDNSTMHSVEHMFATLVRNSRISDDVVYFGPMGCQTGFYLLVRDKISKDEVLDIIKNVLNDILAYDGEIFGYSDRECGNYRSLKLEAAKQACNDFLSKIKNLENIKKYSEL
ncbi:MAG: S-ribosylhomocysteine lyase [Bacillota bacterium]|nr:S-ribosylhomocysteine lyase [Bacillota bacterium]